MTSTTLKDVAAFAKVSLATVSRVLNDNASVDAELRARVQEAVRILGYEPNRAARRLRAQSSNIVGLVISDIQNPYFLSIIRAVEEVAHANRMNIVLCDSNEDPIRQELHLEVMRAERVAGLIFVPTTPSPTTSVQRLRSAGIAIVLIDRLLDDFPVDVVKVDNVRGVFDAVKYLIRLGYKRVGIVNGALSLSTGSERFQGYREALESAHIPYDERLVRIGNFKIESGYQLTKELVTQPHPPDALFIANNLMTLGALRALRERNIRVPHDIALVGFDDMPWSGDLYSPLTAVSQPTYELGQEAMHLLLRRLAEPKSPFRTLTLQTQLVVRESCGANLARTNHE
jgi:LacI family transcriptional regulator, galactose operon repressor